VFAAYLSAHKTMINGSALARFSLLRSVTDLVGLSVAEPFRTPNQASVEARTVVSRSRRGTADMAR